MVYILVFDLPVAHFSIFEPGDVQASMKSCDSIELHETWAGKNLGFLDFF